MTSLSAHRACRPSSRFPYNGQDGWELGVRGCIPALAFFVDVTPIVRVRRTKNTKAGMHPRTPNCARVLPTDPTRISSCARCCPSSFCCSPLRLSHAGETKRYLYVVAPGIRDYLEFGGAGILVFDIDNGHKLRQAHRHAGQRAKRSRATSRASAPAPPRGKLYFTTPTKLYCVDLRHREDALGEGAAAAAATACRSRPTARRSTCRRSRRTTGTSSTATTGDVVATIETKSGAHNTVCGLDGKRMYLAGLKSPLLSVADTTTHKVVEQGRPVQRRASGRSRSTPTRRCAYVNVNGLLGFEIGDLKTGKMLHRVEVTGFKKGPVKRHGCPSHGIGLTPDEKEVWVCDAANSRAARLRRHGDAAEADRQHQAARAAGLGDVQPRRPATPTPRPAR